MNATETQAIKNEIIAKAEIVQNMPKARNIYSDPIKFGMENVWNFSEDRYTTEEDYATDINDRLSAYNEEASAYNSVLASIFRFLSK